MKKKNKIEQELDRKEFEKDINRDLSSQYQRMEVFERMHEGKNPYVIGILNFVSTFFFFEIFYWLIRWNLNFFTLGFSVPVFEAINPLVHLSILILSVIAVIKKKSIVEIVIDRWPF